ncbi:uncharacterized protein LOC134227023 [Armigeres subalbatus]|uniref:uncharacterized protein LOC134227023 n=1 Tax=Armigeres subalbatus TaxID=124917 RepID=UPI002ED0B98E
MSSKTASKKSPKDRFKKYLKRYQKMQETLRNTNFAKAYNAMPTKDYLADEAFKATLTPHQQKSILTVGAAERRKLLKIHAAKLVRDARNTYLENKDFGEYNAKLVEETDEAAHKATTEYFEDRNKVDDMILISMDTEYYLTLVQNGTDPRCFIELF